MISLLVYAYRSLAMNDSDFSDAGEVSEAEKRAKGDKGKGRGEAKSWVELYRFANATEFKSSTIAKRLADEFSCRKNREFQYADVQEYECKFMRRVGYLPCPWKLKVIDYNN